jgi:eukaryotic-like serine/threonine-protein kinase
MAAPNDSFFSRLRDRAARSLRWFTPVLTGPTFWIGVLTLVGALIGLYLVMNYVVMPAYTRQGVEARVPEVRELPFEQATTIIEGRGLRAERRDQPYNPSIQRGAVVDQNPAPNAAVKPGRRVYLYVNSGPQQMVTVPDVLTLSQNLAKSQLAELGLNDVEVRQDSVRSPYDNTVTRQRPEPGEVVATRAKVTLWVSPGLGNETVRVPDVRGLAPVDARRELVTDGLWVDPTRSIGGTVTRQEPAPGEEVRQGTEVRIYSEPLEEVPEASPESEAEVFDAEPGEPVEFEPEDGFEN